ncbi:unnamed protein product [Moneuplotes crassus]|uniref:Uncharacterized protein n=1 Tax=Euplotes crassus TaxID=5936 RepID=A0AAD1UD65_EUPCR|nr:unnamed protein product [Moneuplotes crassus]
MASKEALADLRRKSMRIIQQEENAAANMHRSSKKKLGNDPTFGLTGVDHGGAKTGGRTINETASGCLITEEDVKNRSMYEKSPFGLSIGRIDKKYDHWKTVKERKEKQAQEFESQMEKWKNKEKTREKSYNKYLKAEREKKKTQFHKWSDKRQTAKKYHERTLKDKEDSGYLLYKKEMREFKKKQKEKAEKEYEKMKEDMNTTFMVAGVKEEKQRIRSQQRAQQEYDESKMMLRNLDNKVQTVTNRLNDNFKKRIETLNNQNTRTQEIKVKMNQYEEEKKEKHFLEYLNKQMDYMKRMKKLKKAHKNKIVDKQNKSVDIRNTVNNNKKSKALELEAFKDKVKAKHRKIHNSVSKEQNDFSLSEKVSITNQKRHRHHLKIKNHQKKLQEKFKQSIIDKHLTKTRHKEILQKKKADLMEFSLLKQKEVLYER